MSKKNQKRKKEMKEQQGCPRPWRQIDDTVVDAHGRIVKAPHGCSWEGDNYNDGAAAAQIIVEAVNNSQQPQPVPDGYVLVPVEPTEEMLIDGAKAARDFLSEAGQYPRSRAVYRAMLASSPKPGGD